MNVRKFDLKKHAGYKRRTIIMIIFSIYLTLVFHVVAVKESGGNIIEGIWLVLPIPIVTISIPLLLYSIFGSKKEELVFGDGYIEYTNRIYKRK